MNQKIDAFIRKHRVIWARGTFFFLALAGIYGRQKNFGMLLASLIFLGAFACFWNWSEK